MAAFVFAKGVISVEELAQIINGAMRDQNDKLRGLGDCLRIDDRVVAFIHQKTVPPSVIFVDKNENLPFIEAAREVTVLKEFEGID